MELLLMYHIDCFTRPKGESTRIYVNFYCYFSIKQIARQSKCHGDICRHLEYKILIYHVLY